MNNGRLEKFLLHYQPNCYRDIGLSFRTRLWNWNRHESNPWSAGEEGEEEEAAK
jgi:hypothetical protein